VVKSKLSGLIIMIHRQYQNRLNLHDIVIDKLTFRPVVIVRTETAGTYNSLNVTVEFRSQTFLLLYLCTFYLLFRFRCFNYLNINMPAIHICSGRTNDATFIESLTIYMLFASALFV